MKVAKICGFHFFCINYIEKQYLYVKKFVLDYIINMIVVVIDINFP